MANYRDWVKQLLQTFDGYYAERFRGLIGLLADIHAEGARLAVIYGWPAQTMRLPPDALKLIGRARNMPRYLGETDSDYQDRLADAWSAWQRSGTPAELTNQLGLYGLSNITIVPAKDTLSASSWSEFWVIIDSPHPWASVDPTEAEVTQIRNIIRKWKAAEEACGQFAIVRSGPIWGYNMTWNSFTWADGTGVLTYDG